MQFVSKQHLHGRRSGSRPVTQPTSAPDVAPRAWPTWAAGCGCARASRPLNTTTPRMSFSLSASRCPRRRRSPGSLAHVRSARVLAGRGVMLSLARILACTVLALVASTSSFVAFADERTACSAQCAEAASRQAQEGQRRQREERLRWEYERRRSAAHARMPNTLHASTPSAQAHTDLSRPALADEDTRRIYRRFLDGRGVGQSDPGASGVAPASAFRKSGITVVPAGRQSTAASSLWPASATTKDNPGSHLVQASGWMPASYLSKSATEDSQHVYLFPSASEPQREGS